MFSFRRIGTAYPRNEKHPELEKWSNTSLACKEFLVDPNSLTSSANKKEVQKVKRWEVGTCEVRITSAQKKRWKSLSYRPERDLPGPLGRGKTFAFRKEVACWPEPT